MEAQTAPARDLPLIRGGDRLGPRMPYEELRGEGSLLRFRYPNGVIGWLTTDADVFRTVLGDPRFHAKRFAGEPQAGAVSVSVPEMPGFIPGMNGPDHLRVRRLAAADFSVKRIQALVPYIEGVVAEHLDRIEGAGPPAELYGDYCLPIPSEIIAHILGVPAEHTADFQEAARLTIGGREETLSDPDAPARAVSRLHEIISGAVAEKRRRPAEDLLTKLALAEPPLSIVEICGLSTNLLLAGHESTSSTAALSIIQLCELPEQRRLFTSMPERLPQFVEEFARIRTILIDSGTSIPRLATEDVEVAGQLVRAGEWVMASNGLANADPSVCPHNATRLDLDREGRPSAVTFGYGPHTCLGQHLARAELQAILGGIFQRFPALALTTPARDLPWLESGFGYRVGRVPVTW